MSEPGDSEQLH